MRWIRLLQSLLSSRFRGKLAITETSTIKFTVWLTDIDASIMNHAAMMTVFEAGRLDLMVRTGFFKKAREKNWYFPSTSVSVQFFRPLKAFQRALLTTRVFHVDEQFIYTEQKIIRRGKDIAICIVKSKVKSGKENVPTGEIIKLLNADKIPKESKELIELFEKQDAAFKNKICIQ
ncbi:MAG TPA: acyl-CoA thioesterase [Chitinophagaceae bacterium]|nr:acyl-CoA thioesterase [Chitinophagaceae bacterium]